MYNHGGWEGGKAPTDLEFDIFLLNFQQKRGFLSFEWMK